MPAASVIIRSYNEADYIENTLKAVTGQAYDDFEIILVDSGSTDGTLEIAETYVDDIVFVDPRNFTFGYSLNVGCNAASGTYCVFLSAHAIPTDDEWLGTLVENLHEENVAMTYSNQTGAGPTKFSEDRLFDKLFPEQRKRQQPPDYFANNASSAIKKSLWEEHHFNEKLTGHEDIEWTKHFMDQGYTVVYEPGACIYHIHDESWEQVYRRFEREAIADKEIGIRTEQERWREYAAVPRDIITDFIAAVRQQESDRETLQNIVRFRYYQHLGSANGLQKKRNLTDNRYEYFYSEANEQVQIVQPGEATVTESSMPEVRPNDVLVEIKYAGITDRELEQYQDEDRVFPIIPGREYVGEVIDRGANVEGISAGDRVTGGSVFHCGLCPACDDERYAACENRTELGTRTKDGAFSQYLAIPATHVYPLPEELLTERAVLARPLASVIDGFVRAESFVDTANSQIFTFGNGLLGKLAELYLDQQGYSWCTIGNVTTDTAIEACEIAIVAPTSDDQIQEVLRRTAPGTAIVLLGTNLNETIINPEYIAEKVLITTQRKGEDHVGDALKLLVDETFGQVLNGQYPVEQFVRDPLATCTDAEMSLLNLGAVV